MHANEIVGIHNSMDEAVKKYSEINPAIIVHMTIEPVEKKNCGMMIHMKKGELFPLFTDDNKDGIPKIPNFTQVKDIKEVSNRRVCGVVRYTEIQSIPTAVSHKECLNCHVGA